MGVNQSHEGVRTAQSLINLALLTGNIGRPGTGANSITGQCNAMGSRLFSNTTNLLGGHDFLNPDHRRKVAAILGIDAARIPDRNSWSYDEIIEGIRDGKIKGLWVIATNPAHSWIDQGDLHELLGRLDFLVVQDMYATTETAQHADLLLPAAGWGEKEGTLINSERRIGLIKKVARAPGQALADFAIFKLIAHAWGCAAMFQNWSRPRGGLPDPQGAVARPALRHHGHRGLSDARRRGGIQWPYPAGAAPAGSERRLFEDGAFYHPDRRARFLFEPTRPMPEPPDSSSRCSCSRAEARSRQWHTQTRTRKSAVLRKLYPRKVYVEINPEDARAAASGPTRWCSSSRRGGRSRPRRR